MEEDEFGYKVCPNCERKFQADRPNQKYCVKNCRNATWNRKARRLPVGLTAEQVKEVEAIIGKKKLRDTSAEPLEAI